MTDTTPLNDSLGTRILRMADLLARHSDQPDGLTVSYLRDAHRAVARDLADWMREAGMSVHVDALGSVVGRYEGATPDAPVLLTGSHFDTVRNGGRFDGRLGILLPIAVVADLAARGERLGCAIEIVGFAEEEGLRYRSSFLASSALVGAFDLSMLDRIDDDGITMREAMRAAGLPAEPAAIAKIARDRSRLAGFIEVHIEQGPVLLDRGLAVGVVSSIASCARLSAVVTGSPGHAGTTPMTMRRDAAAAAAEMILAVEKRCSGAPGLVGTVGMLAVPGGSANVIPGRCEFSLDIRGPDDASRDAAVADVIEACRQIATRRGVAFEADTTMKVPSAQCSPRLMAMLERSVAAAGAEVFRLPSGAGHDAMMIARATEICMLFVRCGNGGVSHNPLETMTADDADMAARVFIEFARQVGQDATGGRLGQ